MHEPLVAFAIAIAGYIFIGFVLSTVGPIKKVISDEIHRLRGSKLVNAVTNRDPPSELKLLIFRILMTLLASVFWVLVIWELWKKHKQEKELIEMRTGLWFSYMGGSGSINCRDCQHTEEVTSFIHGIDASWSGFQCQSCGKITEIEAGGRGKASQYKESLTCKCGGKFSRDKRLFCPSCKSENLSYDCEYIT